MSRSSAPLAAALLLLIVSVEAHAAKRPNFIVVLLDDLGYGDFSCYGNRRVTTENIDRLAAEGIRFTQYYSAAPICSPSRVGITTGRYPAQFGITSFLSNRRHNRQRGMEQFLDPNVPTLPRMLSKAGYATGHFGKWHMGGQRDVGEAPLISEYGFDESLTQFEGLGERVLGVFDTIEKENGGKRGLELGSEALGRGDAHWIKRYEVTTAFVDRAIAFMKRSQADDEPFYVNVWPDDVHSPHEPPPELRGDGSKSAMYDGVVELVDRQLAPLFDFIRNDPRLRENTVILLTSDNGPEPGAGSAGPFRGHKGELHEGGIREPLIVWGPGLIPEARRGAVDETTVIGAVDLAPSFLSLAGIDSPATIEFDGVDRSSALRGDAKREREPPLLWSRPPDRPGPKGVLPDLAIRDGAWKLLVEEDGSRPELYDLSNDFGEEHNLAAKHPEIVKRLSDRVLAWHGEIAADGRPRRPEARNSKRPDRPVFVNPIAEGADPWVVRHEGAYYWCQSEGNRGVAIWKSDRLTDLGERHVVWTAPESGPHSAQIWAPELHFVDGRWYVYVAASDGENANHRMIVLESEDANPLGQYAFKAALYTGDDAKGGTANRWAIDGTILEQNGKRFFIWSGWEGEQDEQWLYIAPMANPWTVSGNRVRLDENDDHLWERVGESDSERGLNEAPQVLQRDGRTFVVFSCSGSWEPTYKLGMLELREGGDPLKPQDWSERPEPVFQSTSETYGVGHPAFVKSPDGAEDWLVYHAKLDRRPGWRRALFAQPFAWTPDGQPRFGEPIPAGRPLPAPSGQTAAAVRGRVDEDFENGSSRWAYYGHQQYLNVAEGRLHLGVRPAEPVNDYRCGEKAVLRDGHWADFRAQVTIRIEGGGRDAGMLFRVEEPAVGYDAQRGYFVGLLPEADAIVLGFTDGTGWEEIGRASLPVEQHRAYELSVTARDDEITVAVDGRELLKARDDRSRSGTIGLRVVDVHASFDDLRINPPRPDAPPR